MEDLVFITGNSAKAQYLADYLDVPVQHKKLDLPEIQSLSLHEVAEDKARRAFREVSKPVLVEDVSLVFHALGELPGPLIKWFLHSIGNEGISTLLDGYTDRGATATVEFVLYDGKDMNFFQGTVRGIIAKKPKGEAGFGWDPIFIPEGYEKTWAQMDDNEKHKTSMRKMALHKLKKFLEERE